MPSASIVKIRFQSDDDDYDGDSDQEFAAEKYPRRRRRSFVVATGSIIPPTISPVIVNGSGADISVSGKHSAYAALPVSRNRSGSTASYLAISGWARLSSATFSEGSGAGISTGYYSREYDGSGETQLSAERYDAIIDLAAPAPAAASRRRDTRSLCYEFDKEFPHAARPALVRAFETWEEPLDFTFSMSQRLPGKADIVIGMYSGDHGDGQPFTPGPGGVLAHATYPPYGRMHFNRDQPWWYEPVPPPAGVLFFDFQTAAVHEIGHLLGLDHIDDRKAVMYRSVGFCELRRGLTDADVHQLRLLYDPDLNY